MVGDVTPRTELTNVTKKIADLNGKNKVRVSRAENDIKIPVLK